MSENKNIKKVEEKKHTSEKEAKRFNINVDSGKDPEGNPMLFSFSGPESASLGLIYDASHRVLMEIISFLQKRAEDLKPKKPESKTKEDKKEKAKD